jgi:hypothetical protein
VSCFADCTENPGHLDESDAEHCDPRPDAPGPVSIDRTTTAETRRVLRDRNEQGALEPKSDEQAAVEVTYDLLHEICDFGASAGVLRDAPAGCSARPGETALRDRADVCAQYEVFVLQLSEEDRQRFADAPESFLTELLRKKVPLTRTRSEFTERPTRLMI